MSNYTSLKGYSADFYSSIGKRYEAAFAQDPGLLAFIQTSLKYLPPKAHVLDIGCGTGKPVAAGLSAAGHHVTGIDISETMIQLSRAAVPNGEFMVIDMRDYAPPEGRKFDVIFNILSLFTLSREEVETMAERWAAWLQPGGFLGVCMMAAEDLQPAKGGKYDEDGLCARGVTIRFMGTLTPVDLWTRAGWEKLLSQNGFEMLETSTHVYSPPEHSETDDEPHYFMILKKK